LSTKKKSILAIGIVLSTLLIDQIVKIWIKTSFDPYETKTLISGFIELHFIENRGMAFGTEFGTGIWAKYALSIFRFAAIFGIGYYLVSIIKNTKTNLLFLIAIALVFAGATGNLIDGMFYDYFFELDEQFRTNWVYLYNENNDVNFPDQVRQTGFMLGSVVDMFRFTVTWPEIMPFGLSGQEIFPPIWNIADFTISCGIGLLILKYKKNFGKDKSDKAADEITSQA